MNFIWFWNRRKSKEMILLNWKFKNQLQVPEVMAEPKFPEQYRFRIYLHLLLERHLFHWQGPEYWVQISALPLISIHGICLQLASFVKKKKKSQKTTCEPLEECEVRCTYTSLLLWLSLQILSPFNPTFLYLQNKGSNNNSPMMILCTF